MDAKHAHQQLDTRRGSPPGGFADQIFSKTDFGERSGEDELIHRLKHMNPRAGIEAVHFGQVPLERASMCAVLTSMPARHRS